VGISYALERGPEREDVVDVDMQLEQSSEDWRKLKTYVYNILSEKLKNWYEK
jgi:hypothetical protein